MSKSPTETIFSKIIAENKPEVILYENDKTVVIADLYPQAKFHFLVITKQPYANLLEMPASEYEFVADAIKFITEDKQISDGGYRVVTNTGDEGGQSVEHLHFHVLGGERLASKIG